MNVAVIGAGAVGVTVAHDLAQRGVSVTLYERGDIAAGSSGRAAGVLYDAYADRKDAAIGRRAIERFREISGDGDFEFEPCPYVWLARDGDERRADAIREQVSRMREHGLDVTLLDGDDLGERFPALRTDDVSVAGITTGAGYANPERYVRAMADNARAAGVEIRTGAEASIRTDRPRVLAGDDQRTFDAVLVAAGAHTRELLAEAGVQIPLKPYRVQALTGGPNYDGPMCYDATEGFYFRPHPAGLLAGDGTEPIEADPNQWERAGDDWFVSEVCEGVAHRAQIEVGVERAWAGLCVATPDHNPLLGELIEGVYVAVGWQGHGFMRSPALAEQVVKEMLGGEGISGFDPTRFDGDEEFEIVEGMAI